MSFPGPIRMTESRKAILSVLGRAESHPTADEVYQAVRERLPKISLGTVYRNLDLLAKQGLIRTLGSAGEQRRYDAILEQHDHIRCEVCGRMDDVELTDAGRFEGLLVDGKGYKVHGYTLCFSGVCRECASDGGSIKEQGRE